MSDRATQIRELYRQRPKSFFLRLNLVGAILLTMLAWNQLDVQWSELIASRRLENLRAFGHDVYPFSLRNEPLELTSIWNWQRRIWRERGYEAVATTFSISVVAIVMAGIASATFVFPASRNVATSKPFLGDVKPSRGRNAWRWSIARNLVRATFIVSRSIPEYIWAFLLIAMIGPGAWPAILALAIHNCGILGKLGAEVVENVDHAVPSVLRGKGLTRSQISLFALVPMCLSKWLLFFFYRWETCVREATVLGMLGIVSLGFWVRETRARDWYDEMLYFILLGALLVFLGDIISSLTRRYVRRA